MENENKSSEGSVDPKIGIKIGVKLIHKSDEKLKTRNNKSIEEVEVKVDSEGEMQYVKTRSDNEPTKVMHKAFTPDGRLKHLHCKGCGNNWNLAERARIGDKFGLGNGRIKCRKCGSEVFDYGSGQGITFIFK